MKTECALCSRPGTEPFSTKRDGIRYHRCPACGYIRMDKTFCPDEETERRRYLLHENGTENAGYIRWLKAFLDFALAPDLPGGAAVLDFGSGPEPVMADLMTEMGFEVFLEDPFFSPGRPEGPFRLITASEVFEHLSRPAEALESLSGRLLPGGRLCISTEFLPDDPAEFEKWHYRSDPTHIGFFTSRGLAEAASASGLEKRECDGRRYIAFEKPSW